MKDLDEVFWHEWFDYGIWLACKDLPELYPPIRVRFPTPKLSWKQSSAITDSSREYAAANLVSAPTPLRQAEIDRDREIRTRAELKGGLSHIGARDKKDFDDVLLDKWLRQGIALWY
jgi:hypothetical protein